jgi:hypothetical protein
LITPLTGAAATTRAFAATPGAVRCQFTNANATSAVLVTIAPGTSASYLTLQAASSGGGRTITLITTLGSAAFSISNNGAPAGVVALSSHGVLYNVSTNLPITKDETLIRGLMTLP